MFAVCCFSHSRVFVGAVIAFALCVDRSICMNASCSTCANFVLFRKLFRFRNSKDGNYFCSKALLLNCSFVVLKVKLRLDVVRIGRWLMSWLKCRTSIRHFLQQILNRAIPIWIVFFQLLLMILLQFWWKWYWNNKFFLVIRVLILFIKIQILIWNSHRNVRHQK